MKSLKHKAKAILSSKLSLVGLVLLLGVLVVQYSQIFYKRYETEQEMVHNQKQIEVLQGEQQSLKDLLAYLNSDFFAEREARIKLGMQRPGERVVVLPHATPVAEAKETAPVENAHATMEAGAQMAQGGVAEVTVPKKQNNPSRWVDYFFAGE